MQGPLVAVPFFRIFATVKTMHLRLKQCLAAFMLAVLLAAHAGQKVHIYFAAFSGDLVPDNGAAEQVVEFCVVDDFYFFPYLAETQPPHEFYAEVLAVLRAHRLEPKRLAFVKNRAESAPWLFLVEAQKNRKTGLKIEPDILIAAGAAMYGKH